MISTQKYRVVADMIGTVVGGGIAVLFLVFFFKTCLMETPVEECSRACRLGGGAMKSFDKTLGCVCGPAVAP